MAMQFDPRTGQMINTGVTGSLNPYNTTWKNGGTISEAYDPQKGLIMKPLVAQETPGIGSQGSPYDNLVGSLLGSMAPSKSAGANMAPISSDLLSKYSSMTGPGMGVADRYFNDYIGRIGGPSSVDEVQGSLDSQKLEQMLAQIDQDTHQQIGSAKLDFQDRGLGGPGQMGDIEGNALAQVYSGAGKNKAAARLGGYQAELERQKARESAVNTALGQRYQVGAAADNQARSNAASLLGTEYSGNITQLEGQRAREATAANNYLNQVLDYATKQGTLTQADREFYTKLVSDENQAALNRDSAYQRSLLDKKPDQPDFFTGLGQSLLSGVAGGIGTAVAGPVGGYIGTSLANSMKPKPKTAGVNGYLGG